MPSLTLDRDGTRDAGGRGRDRAGASTGTGPTGGDRRRSATGSTGTGPGEAGGDAWTDRDRPTMDLITPAPSVDATDDDGDGSTAGPSDRDRASGRDRDHRPAPVEELFSPDGPDRLAFDAEMDRVVDELYRRIERRMRIERERRGL